MKNIYFVRVCTVDTEFGITLISLQATEKKCLVALPPLDKRAPPTV